MMRDLGITLFCLGCCVGVWVASMVNGDWGGAVIGFIGIVLEGWLANSAANKAFPANVTQEGR